MCPHCGGRLVLQDGLLWCFCGYEEPVEDDVLPISSAPTTSWPPHANPKGEYHSRRERKDHDA